MAALSGLSLNKDRYVSLLEKLIGEVEYLQDNPPKFVPEEDRAIKHLLDVLNPYSTANGGPLKVEKVNYVENRGNLIIEYSPAEATGTIAFVGSHLDVVPANPETWERNPFKLVVEGDKLYGRGTTDCLGHVALVTELFLQLAETKPQLKQSIVAVFIAAEESFAIPGVGVDKLVERGRLEFIKNGPVFWVDSADINPCMGTASAAMWKMRVEGRLFHSGLPHKGINSIELAMEATEYIQKRFYEDFPPHEEEKRYQFATPSTLKPTQICCAEGSLNQIPPWTEVSGDIRLTPFYSIDDCVKKVKGYVDDIIAELGGEQCKMKCRGPCSRYQLDIPEGVFKGKIDMTFQGEVLRGIAVNLDSPAFKNLDSATSEVMGESKPYSITGSLPLVGDLQKAGFDVQICGYGHSSVYHGDNEYCTLSVMEKAFQILCGLINKYNQ